MLALIFLLIHLPPVQNYIISEATTYLTEGTGYQTKIGYANIKWFNSIALDDVKIYDQEDILMIGVEELALTFSLSDLLGKKDIKTKEAWLKGADVNLRNIATGGLNVEDWADRISDLSASEDTITTEPSIFTLDQITLLKSKFSISDSRKDSIKDGFDYNHFQLIDLNADLLNLKTISDTFQIDVKKLTTKDSASGLSVDHLETFFRNSQSGLIFYDIDLQMGKSRIKDFIEFKHEKPSQMAYFEDSVDLRTDLSGTVIHTDELGFFVPELKKLNQEIEITGLFQGRINKFYSDNFNIQFGNYSRLEGSFDIEGLPSIEQTFFALNLRNSTFRASDIRQYMDNESFRISDKFGLIRMSGRFDGLLKNFVADGSFNTALGKVQLNTQFEIPEDGLPKYRGDLFLNNFNLGDFTEVSNFDRIDLDGAVEGKGLTLETANFLLNASIPKIDINQYEYSNIETDGTFAESFFSGQVEVNDPNFKLFATGSVDIRDKRRIFKLRGRLDTALLKEVNLTEKEMEFSSSFDMDFSGLVLDSLDGTIELTNSYYRYEQQAVELDSVFFIASRTDGGRKLVVESDYLNADFNGDFEFSKIAKELGNINEQYRLQFSSRTEQVDQFIARNPRTTSDFNMNYRLNLKDVSPIINLFDSTIYISKNTQINGRFNNESGESILLESKIDTIQLGKLNLFNNQLNLNADRIRDRQNVLALGYLSSEKQIYGNLSETEKLVFEAVWDGNQIGLRQNLSQESSGNFAEVSANVNFFPGRTELRFEDSNITALNEQWRITNENVIVFGDSRIDIENLSVFNTDQSISFNGEVAVVQDSAKTLSIDFQKVEVSNINSLTNEEYTGQVSGVLSAQNLYFNPIVFGDLEVKDFRINQFLVGDLDGSITWNDFRKRFDVDFEVNRLDKKTILLSGEYYPSRDKDQLNIDLQLDDANINIAEPYIDDYFSKLGGIIDGEYKISGNTNAPIITGTGSIVGGKVKVNYLNTNYAFNGGIVMREKSIDLENLEFRDNRNFPADFRGSIKHDNFKNLRLNLVGDLQDFQVLNTNIDNGDSYYGAAYATGEVSLTGAASNLNISANVRTESDTKLYIPITEDTGNNDIPEYITFVDRTLQDTTSTNQDINNDEVNKIEIEGLSLDLDIEVTPDAYVEIIIDPKTGDIIRGRGEGQLRLQIDSQGDFQMTGELDITEGSYNFSLYNLIVKEFDIEQPSTITWFGNPYEAIVDINASYTQNTSIAPLLDQAGVSGAAEGGGVSRRVPSKVLLSLTGPMLSPNINFDIEVTGVNTNDYLVTTALNAFENRIQSDEQEMNRQVLSLIVLNRFTEQGGLNIGGGSPTQNVSQLLSNQLSQLVAQLDENLEINFDLASLDEDAFNTFRLRLSYTFLDGRLRVTREGGITGLQDINNIAGDWTAEYLLTTDGRYKVKVYSQSNYDLANLALNQSPNNQTRGASISQTTSFNTFKEFFQGVNRKRKVRQQGSGNSGNTSGDSN